MKGQKAFFYKASNLFNDIRLNKPINKAELDEIISFDDHDLILSALFIFLNKTSYRGVFVVNSKNEYKGSFGYISNVKIVKPALINKLHQLFVDNNVDFICCSYDELDLGDDKMLL